MTISNSSGTFKESMMNNSHQNSSSSSFSNNNNNYDVDAAAADFECNVCLDLAHDPVVTLCGHLFCWPCLYKWLHLHSRSRECPVCKALIEEDKLVPLYGRGKNSTDPRVKSIPDVDIPNRPTGQRPATAPDVNSNNNNNQHFGQNGFGFMGGFGGVAAPTAAGATRFGSLTLSAAFGGLIPALFNLHVHGFSDAAVYGMNPNGFPIGGHGAANWFHGGQAHWFPQQHPNQGNQDYYLKILFLFVGVCVIFVLIGL